MPINFIISSSSKGSFPVSSWLIPLCLTILLLVTSNYNFLLFHTLAELFAIIVAILISVVAWQMYPYTGNNYLMYLGCGYFWVACMDLLHTLTYEGISILEISGADIGVQYWIGSRYIEAFILLSSPYFLKNKLNRNLAFLFYGLVSLLVVLSITKGIFPTGYIEGIGLTQFKIVSEYIIISMLIASVGYIFYQRELLEKNILNIMILSIVFTMCAELAFTLYIGVHDLSNFMGHIFKLFSFWLIFMGIVRSTLQEPFSSLSKSAITYDAIPDATIVVDNTGVIRQVNNSACKLSGIKKEELIGKIDHDVFHQQDTAVSDCPVCNAIHRDQMLDGLELPIDKNDKYYSFSTSDLPGITGSHLTVECIRDVTNKKKAETKYSSLSSLKNSILENLPVILFVKDAKELRYVEWNKAAEEITGLSKEDMLGKNDYDLWPKEEADFFQKKDREVLTAGELLDIPEEPISTKKGTHIMHTTKIPLYDNDGKESYLLGISEDITAKQKTELALRQSQKMDALGRLTGGIAHDFNNSLNVVLGYSEMLIEKLQDNPKLCQYADNIYNAGRRSERLTKKLLNFSREKNIQEAEIINVTDILIDERDMLEKTLTANINLKMDLEDNLSNVWLEPGDFEDALLNLSINAMHAMHGKGDLLITTKNQYLDEINSRNLNLQAGYYVELTLSDTGCGMSQEVQSRIFDPFFSTKGKDGTGLGLSQVYGFVHSSGGAIKVYSEPDHGTRFSLYFPRYNESDDKQQAEEKNYTVDIKGTETILVVDDEPALLSLSCEILTQYGFNVIPAENAKQALEILQHETVDLLVSDIIMPDMDGYQLAAIINEKYPAIKIQLVSGFSDNNNVDMVNESLHQNLLLKPFNAQSLLKSIRKLLDEAQH